MSAAIDQDQGQCRCGRVTFAVTGRPLVTMACHCRGCQRLSGGAYSLSSVYPRDAFELLGGETELGGLHGPSHYVMCSFCKSWIYTEPDGMEIINIRTPLLLDPPKDAPFVEMATEEGFEWARIGAKHSFGEFPQPDDYPPILEEYAALQND